MPALKQQRKTDVLVELAKRRGIFWPSYEIYGGVRGLLTLGNIGFEIKRRLENLWIKYFVYSRNFQIIESPVIGPRPVYVASGHESQFTDKALKCEKCGAVFRADHLLSEAGISIPEGASLQQIDEIVSTKGVKCPNCKGDFSKAFQWLLMFKTEIGAGSGEIGYLRPETAQGIFTEFKRLYVHGRSSLPMGVAQVGRVFRNEVSPRQGPIRLREFTIMEVEFFFDPDSNPGPSEENYLEHEIPVLTAEDQEKGVTGFRKIRVRDGVETGLFSSNWLPFFLVLTKRFLEALKIPDEAFRFREKLPSERAHYAKQLFDCEVLLESWGWTEVAGFAYRTDFDLSGHMRVSGEDMNVFISSSGRRIVPHVVEPSFGAERLLYALLEYSLRIEEDGRICLSTPPYLSPFDVSVFPLLSKPDFVKKAAEVARMLGDFKVNFDDSGSIGRRYARSDEIGIPFAVTIDHQTFSDNSVTLRFRDTREQRRIEIGSLHAELSKLLSSPKPDV
ncbi:MAG: glycine--tRNA ligase [Candidatus Brockarchaeota archaeon]|nr:glycine--tRNA ligase [Candidatus Brockarchaeota archaeon]